MPLAASCKTCGQPFEQRRIGHVFCSPKCRLRQHRAPTRTAAEIEQVAEFVDATRRELERLDAVDTLIGQQVLTVARAMARPAQTGASLASLSREHCRLMAEIVGESTDQDELAELWRRRDAKVRAATSHSPNGHDQ